jgi:hypothetical protein
MPVRFQQSLAVLPCAAGRLRILPSRRGRGDGAETWSDSNASLAGIAGPYQHQAQPPGENERHGWAAELITASFTEIAKVG